MHVRTDTGLEAICIDTAAIEALVVWLGWVGGDGNLCRHLLYEHRSAVLIIRLKIGVKTFLLEKS